MVRSQGLIIASDIINNSAFSLSDILVAAFGHPLGFETAEEALSWRVVPTISTTARTLYHSLTTCPRFSEPCTGVMDSLIGMK